MRKSFSFDYIIVGQGLAGSSLAVNLINAGKKIVVIDEPLKNNCSRVAAGLFNPVTGKNLVKTWLSNELFPYLQQFYNNVEELTGRNFFYPTPLYRPFISVEEQNEWMGKSADPEYKNIIERIYTAQEFDGVINPKGGLLLKHCGYINTNVFMEAVRAIIYEKGVFVDSFFDHAKLIIEQDCVRYEEFEASKIIFCEGANVRQNPWFKQLPVRSLKGEILVINCNWNEHVILNSGVYIVPGNQKNEFRVGSTYNLKDKTDGVTMSGKIELESKLTDLIDLPYEITGQTWGVRPTTIDRRPILGQHPKFKQLLIFNGLGTKGVSLAPYFSHQLVQWLENAGSLSRDVDVTRFKLLY